jgi:MerR family redox-sensitive transcriptional activator SoxR
LQKTAQDLMTIGDVAKRSGLSISAIRFYEEKGLIRSLRTNGNQRRYARHMLRRLALIKVAQRVGLSLQDIQQAFANLPEGKAPSKADWQKMSSRWQQQLEEKIQLLQNMQTQLDWCIGCGCLSLDNCPLRNPQDIFATDPENHAYWEK